MILVVLSTHAELASATARGRSYWETGELTFFFVNQGGSHNAISFTDTRAYPVSIVPLLATQRTMQSYVRTPKPAQV